MERVAYLFALVSLVVACVPNSPEVTRNLVEPARLQAHVEFLASDTLRGRDTGSRGYEVAAEYVASQFQQLGMRPGGADGSWFQQVPLSERRLVDGSARAVLSAANGNVVELQYPDQFIMGPDRARVDVEVKAPLVFVGYGIVSSDYDHDDYAGLDVEGKIVVALTGRPQAWPTEEGSHLASGREKLRHAVERGAVGFVTLHSPREEARSPYVDNFTYLDVPGMSWIGPDGLPEGYFPQIKGGAYLNMDAAQLMFEGAPQTLESIYQADAEQQAIQGFVLPGELSLARQSTFSELASPNVVGVIEGSDPELKDEYLLYSAHLDHLGVIKNADGEEEIYNGAMDNAAGIAILLETARVLQSERTGLKRSVMFVAVTGEEKGLLGAGYFASNPTVPIENIVANINLDMPLLLYPFADVIAFGAEHSTLKSFVDRAAASAGVKLSPDPMPEQGLFTRSDHYRLVQQGVPAVFLVTGFESRDPENSGADVFQTFLKEHYHQPSDNLALPIDYQAGALFGEININIGREVCNSDERPRWNEGDFFGRTFYESRQN